MVDPATQKAIVDILWKYLDKTQDTAFIFGSWATGENRKFSDIDIGIESKRKLPSLIIESLKEAFEKSDVPYLVEIVDFADVSEQFRQVAKQKIILLN